MPCGRIAVVGGGVGGVAAAWAARRLGCDVRLYHFAAGATELGCGAADFAAWAPAPFFDGGSQEVAGPLPDEVGEFLDALGYWRWGFSHVATPAGIVRSCLARDPALLDLDACRGGLIAVANVERDDWDAAGLARTLNESAWARNTGTRFCPDPVAALREGYERRIAPADFAALHDDEERRGRLTTALRAWRQGAGDRAGLLLGPWLGLEARTLRELRESVDCGLGECTSSPGGPSGLRFARTRQRLLSEAGVELHNERVVEVCRASGAWRVTSVIEANEGEAAAQASDVFSAVVLALGGFVSGGIEFAPRQERAAAFRLNLAAPVALGFHGEALEQVSSTYGFDPATARGAWLERAGVIADETGRLGAAGLLAAGDVVASRPRTVLEAIRAGITAARSIG